MSRSLAAASLSGRDSFEFRSLAYLYWAVRDRVVFEFVTGPIWKHWQAGLVSVRREDFLAFIDRLNALLYRRQEPHHYAFDCLWLDGRDLGQKPLIERKQILRTLVPALPSRLLYVSHVEERGVDFFQEVCRQDLEGIVAKLKTAPYGTEPPSWVKIKNADYSQGKDRHERFEKMRARRTVIRVGGSADRCLTPFFSPSQF